MWERETEDIGFSGGRRVVGKFISSELKEWGDDLCVSLEKSLLLNDLNFIHAGLYKTTDNHLSKGLLYRSVKHTLPYGLPEIAYTSVPIDYFPESITSKFDINQIGSLLVYLLASDNFSVRSGLAQAGTILSPSLTLGAKGETLPSSVFKKDTQEFIIEMFHINQNPYRTFVISEYLERKVKLPILRRFSQELRSSSEHQSPQLRFVIPAGKPVKGNEVLDIVKQMTDRSIGLVDTNGRSISSEDTEVERRQDIIMARIPITVWLEFLDGPKYVDLKALTSISARNRTQLDELLGLASRSETRIRTNAEVVIGETIPIKMPSNYIGIIEDDFLQATTLHGTSAMSHHVNSRVIDPGFSSLEGKPLPIRVEFAAFGHTDVRELPQYIDVRFFKA